MAQNTIPKNVPVALAAGTHTWFPTPESEAVTNQILDVLRKYKIVNLDTARSYVSILYFVFGLHSNIWIS